MNPHVHPADPAACPLCGQPNQCALAAGQPASACWCMQQPALTQAQLAHRLPPGTPAHCLCPACQSRLAPEPPPLAK